MRNAVRRARGPRSRGRSGFTLIETLVAVAIMAALLAVVPGGLVTAQRNIDQSEALLRARLVAEAALSGDLGGNDLVPGMRQGQISGRNWTAVIGLDNTLLDPAVESLWVPLIVSVTVEVSNGRSLTVTSERVGHAG